MRIKNPHLFDEHIVIVNQAVDYIEAHATEDLTLQDVSAAVAVSPRYFHGMFKSVVQENVGEYIIRRKLEIAAHYILFWHGKTLTEIASQCGFSSLSSFSRAFKAQYGINPTTYMQDHRTIKSNLSQIVSSGCERYFYKREYNEGHTVSNAYSMRMTIREFPPVQAVYYRCYGGGDEAAQIAENFRKLSRLASSRQLWRSDTVLVGVLKSPWYAGQSGRARHDACLTLRADSVLLIEGHNRYEIAGGSYAVIRFEEPEAKVRELMTVCLQHWLPGSGYVFDLRPVLMIHYNDPQTAPNGNMTVDFCLPVRPAR